MATHHDLTVPDDVIVVVDDDAAVRNSLKFSLEIEGFSVRAFAGPKELLDHKELPSCGFMIIDQNMPELTGIDLIATLRARKVLAPAVLMTSHPSNTLKAQAASAGIAIVEKPLLGDTLVDLVHRAMASRPAPGA
jgi:FixJ family two-component response regulator